MQDHIVYTGLGQKKIMCGSRNIAKKEQGRAVGIFVNFNLNF